MADERRTIPLADLVEAPWNPKVPITSVYRAGLRASIDHFAPKGGGNPLRDDLKVWPDPEAAGRYIVLDGNQRLGLLRESGVAEVECRVLADLDPEDARLFTASFDRNVAKHDEAKLAALAGELGSIDDDLIATILRPDSVVVAPPPLGDMPEVEPAPGPVGPTIPVMFELTSEGYERVMAGALRTKARLKREARLTQAMEALSERRIDDGVVELALRIFAP
jgi:ParB-like chromosome segregation protein Spo0J